MMMRVRWLLLLSVVCFATVDQLTKSLIKLWLLPEVPWPVLPKFFQLTLAYNTGAAFSLLRHQPQLLVLFTSALFLILVVYSLTRSRYTSLEFWALALLMGGALGNLTDRLLFGQVTDFFDVVAIHYPVFNVADVFIFCGALLLVCAHVLIPSAPLEDVPPQPSDAP